MFHFQIPMSRLSPDFNLHLLYYKYPPFFEKYRKVTNAVSNIQNNFAFDKGGTLKFLEELTSVYRQFPFQSLKNRLASIEKYATEEELGKVVRLKNTSRFLCGIGYQSPIEWGFQFDWTTGLPYLPGSSFKGALVSYLEWLAGKPVENWDGSVSVSCGSYTWNKNDVFRVFGPQGNNIQEKRIGETIFFDVYPVLDTFKGFKVDVITPHYRPYYDNPSNPPADIYNPVPIYFLTLAPGTHFKFMFKIRKPLTSPNRIDKIEALITETGENFGFGAKTNTGYGFFSVV